MPDLRMQHFQIRTGFRLASRNTAVKYGRNPFEQLLHPLGNLRRMNLKRSAISIKVFLPRNAISPILDLKLTE